MVGGLQAAQPAAVLVGAAAVSASIAQHAGAGGGGFRQGDGDVFRPQLLCFGCFLSVLTRLAFVLLPKILLAGWTHILMFQVLIVLEMEHLHGWLGAFW